MCVRHRGDLLPLLPVLTLGALARGAQQASQAWPSATRPETDVCSVAEGEDLLPCYITAPPLPPITPLHSAVSWGFVVPTSCLN